MTNRSETEWRVFAEGDDVNNVPLWHVLAQLRSDDLDDGWRENTLIINKLKASYAIGYNAAFFVSFSFGILFLIFSMAFLLSDRSTQGLPFILTLVTFAAAVAPHLWRQAYQYGWNIPDSPLNLPHESDEVFEELLGYLQRVGGPKVFYISRFRKKAIPLKQRQFFGKLRYFLFSEKGTDRAMVMRFPTAMSLTTDLYMHRNDVEKIIALRASPEKEVAPQGSKYGQRAKYPYIAAAVGVALDDPLLVNLDLSDRKKVVSELAIRMTQWFETKEWMGLSEARRKLQDAPEKRSIDGYAEEFYEALLLRKGRNL
ncbi:MAG: hypothetical protein ACK5NN_00110 [Sphingomonadaceae bacterium]